MEMKWNPIIDGDLSGIPRDEELLFTIFDEEDGETYATACCTEEGFHGDLTVRSGARYYEEKCLLAWMDFPPPYKPKKKCFSCTHLVDWMDEFGERWFECELLNVPFKKIKPGECQLKSRN